MAEGAAVRARNRRGAEALHYAADGAPNADRWDENARIDLISYLIDAGADPNVVDHEGVTPAQHQENFERSPTSTSSTPGPDISVPEVPFGVARRRSPGCRSALTIWPRSARKMATRIARLIGAIQRDPFTGIGKPEPLKGDLSGYWSRRIDDEHRLVYRADDAEVKILKARYHYSQ